MGGKILLGWQLVYGVSSKIFAQRKGKKSLLFYSHLCEDLRSNTTIKATIQKDCYIHISFSLCENYFFRTAASMALSNPLLKLSSASCQNMMPFSFFLITYSVFNLTETVSS